LSTGKLRTYKSNDCVSVQCHGQIAAAANMHAAGSIKTCTAVHAHFQLLQQLAVRCLRVVPIRNSPEFKPMAAESTVQH